jgi:hypothetical protein
MLAFRLRSPFAAIEGLLDRFICVAGAVIFSQAPEFMQQYLQRLGGRLDEARRQLDQMRAVAARSGLTLDQLTSRTESASDPSVSRLGGVLREAVERVDALSAAETALRHASILARPFVFLRRFDPAVASATWSVFKPAVPTTVEGAVYALGGAAAMLGAYHFALRRPIRRAWSSRANRLTLGANPPGQP